MKTNANWVKDHGGEAQIKAMGLAVSVKEIPPSLIDEKQSRMHSGRLDAPVDSELADQYREDMRRGDAFPMLITCETSGGKMMILGGNTRHEALKPLGFDSIPVYVVECKNEETREMLPRILNATHGKRSTLEDRTKQAIAASKRFAWPVNKAALLFKIGEHTLRNALKASETAAALSQKGVSSSHLSQGHLIALGKLGSQSVMVPMAKLVSEARLTSDLTSELVKEICDIKTSEIDKIARVSELARKYATNGAEPPLAIKVDGNKLDKKKRCIRVLCQVETVIKGCKSFQGIGIPKDDSGKSLIGRWKAVAERILSLEE